MAFAVMMKGGPAALDALKAAMARPQMSAEDLCLARFGVADPVRDWRSWYDGPERELTLSETIAAFVDEVRPYFVPLDGSDKSGVYQRVNPVALPFWLRLAMLPDLCGLNLNREVHWKWHGARWEGDTEHNCRLIDYSEAGTRFLYEPRGSAPELSRWVKAYPQIRALLGLDVFFRYRLADGVVLVVVAKDGDPVGQFEELPPAFMLAGPAGHPEGSPELLPYEPLPFVPEAHPAGHLAEGYLYLGEQFLDRAAGGHWLKIADLNHTLVMGTSGFGKSVFLNQLLQGVRHNLVHFDQVVLVDLKGGVELWPYQALGREFRVVYRREDLARWIAGLVTTIEDRLELMRERGERSWPGKKVLLVVDEYAQVQLAPETTKEERAAKLALLADLNKLSMLGRAAGVIIWAQLQKGTTDVMDSSFRANLSNQVCFKVPNKLTAAGMFGSTDELLVDPVKLPKGRFVFYDATNGETHYLQARMPELPR